MEYWVSVRDCSITAAKMLRIFVLADTHNKLPPEVVDLAAGADEIWHLGDVCAPTILR